MKCIPFNHDLEIEGRLWREDMGQYEKYVKSHSWKDKRGDDNFNYKQCDRCNAALLTPSGTLSGNYGCFISNLI